MAALEESNLGHKDIRGASTHPNVLGPEEELPAEVGALYVIHVCNRHNTTTSPKAQAH